jgi:hypothetical protein
MAAPVRPSVTMAPLGLGALGDHEPEGGRALARLISHPALPPKCKFFERPTRSPIA